LKVFDPIVASSAGTRGAFNKGFETVNLHRPTLTISLAATPTDFIVIAKNQRVRPARYCQPGLFTRLEHTFLELNGIGIL
jgi:hypothetical protein